MIPTFNNQSTIKAVLEGVFSQKTSLNFEVIVIDSSSTDHTREIAREIGARVYTIPKRCFQHGATRNLALDLTESRIIVFLTADAEPLGKDWLNRLVSGIQGGYAAVYGCQVPRGSGNPMEEFFISSNYPRGVCRELKPGRLEMNSVFSNVNCAISRQVFSRFRFREDLVVSEDIEWSLRILGAGYSILYQGNACVCHSHNYSLKTAFQRFFDIGAAYCQMGRRPGVLRAGFSYLAGELAYVYRQRGLAWTIYAIFYNLSKYIGFQLGLRESLLPGWLKVRLGGQKGFWSKKDKTFATNLKYNC